MEEGGVERTASRPRMLPLPSRVAPDSIPYGARVVLVQFVRVRFVWRACGADGRDTGGEAVAAEQVQVALLERGEPCRSNAAPTLANCAWYSSG